MRHRKGKEIKLDILRDKKTKLRDTEHKQDILRDKRPSRIF
jgi:hypothetical protein